MVLENASVEIFEKYIAKKPYKLNGSHMTQLLTTNTKQDVEKEICDGSFFFSDQLFSSY